MPLTLVTGGARSGKSRYALALAESLGPERVFIATAEAWDEEMADRIRRHQAERGPGWTTLEAPVDVAPLLSQPGRPVVVDCLTLWLGNLLHQRGPEADLRPDTEALLAAAIAAPNPVLFVTNEVGMGIVPDNALARRFRDETGWLAQAIAARAERVVLCVAGLPLALKGSP
jgi:adenosylcobinamide kinase/adenosylcobinamide-phosphate guanylyltransferase